MTTGTNCLKSGMCRFHDQGPVDAGRLSAERRAWHRQSVGTYRDGHGHLGTWVGVTGTAITTTLSS